MRITRFIADFPRELTALPKSIRRISLIMFLYMLAWGTLDPFLTIYFHDIFGNYTDVAIISALVYVFSLLFSLPFGDLIDIVSKKKMMRFFLVMYLPFGFILSLLSTFLQFTFFRFYHAIIAAGLWSSAESYLRAHSPPRKAAQSMGFFDSVTSLSIIIGAVVGGAIVTLFGIKTLFYIFPFFVASALFILPVLPDHDGGSSIWRGIKQLRSAGVFRFEISDYLRIPGMVLVSFLSFITSAVSFGALIVIPLFSDWLGASYIETGLIYAAFGIPVLFEAPFSIFVQNFNRKKVLMTGGLLSLLFLTAAYMADNLIQLFILSLFLSAALSLLKPVIEGLATEIMPRHKIGEFNGVYRSVMLAAAASGTLVVGPIADKFSIQAPFLLGAVLMIVFLGIVLLRPLPESI